MNYITIHCAATPNGKYFSNEDIDKWHAERGFQRTAPIAKTFNPHLQHIGYHFVICTDGVIQTGRALGERGAHVENHNSRNLGICLIGMDKFTRSQWDALKTLLQQLLNMDPQAQIKGHYEFDTAQAQGKTCPNFDVQAYVASNGEIPNDHLL